MVFQGFSPDQFMTNFRSNFYSDQDLVDLAQRISEQQNQQQNKKASKESVKKLPVLKIEQKHCKKGENGQNEAPTCAVCCDNIQIGKKGMFMPCGHIYHQDCLEPWLQTNNTCPVCRYELPLE